MKAAAVEKKEKNSFRCFSIGIGARNFKLKSILDNNFGCKNVQIITLNSIITQKFEGNFNGNQKFLRQHAIFSVRELFLIYVE